MYHGVLLSIGAVWKRTGRQLPGWVSRTFLVASVLFGWAIFMSPDAAFLRTLLEGLSGMNGSGRPDVFMGLISSQATVPIILGILVAFSGRSEAAAFFNDDRPASSWMAFLWGVLAALCILLIGHAQNFIYASF